MAKEFLSILATKRVSSVIDKFEQTISEYGTVKAEKRFTLFISNEDVDVFIKILNSLEDSTLLIDGTTETVKYEKNEKGNFLGL